MKFEMLSVAKIAKYRNRHNRQNTIENVSRSTFRYPNKLLIHLALLMIVSGVMALVFFSKFRERNIYPYRIFE